MAINPNSGISPATYINQLTPAQQSLTSGQKINSAADNPAGQAIVTGLMTQINTQDISVRNANDGISLLQTADGASESISNYLGRMNELAIQSQNGTLNDSQRSILNLEFQQNIQSLNDIANNTTFNGQALLNTETSEINISLGDSSNTINLPSQTSSSFGLDGLSIANNVDAASALENIAGAFEQLSLQRSNFGASINGLTSSINAIQEQNTNTLNSQSQILDTDYAKSISDQVRDNILQDSAIAMQAQTNQSRASVLQLLNG